MNKQNTINTEKMAPIGEISEVSNVKSAEFLNNLLANEYALFTKTLNFHWNITGPRFHSLHEFLETQYRELLDTMDDVAERVRVLGHRPLGTIREFNKVNDINEQDARDLRADDMIGQLLKDHMLIQHQIKNILSDDTKLEKDFGTEDFLVSLLQKHEMTSWMLKSHLEKH